MIVEVTVDGERLKKAISPDEWERVLLEILLSCNLSQILTDCRRSAIVEAIWPNRAGRVECCNVSVRAAQGKDWIAASVNGEWAFYFLQDGSWKRVSTRGGVRVGRDGTITAGNVEWRSFQADWPNMLRDPGPYVAAGLIHNLLARDDANPLTILERSPWPFKGLGKQIRATLDAVAEVLPRVSVAPPHN